MRLEKKNIHMNKIVKSETVIFFVSREERIMDADNEIENIINQKEIVTTDGVVTRENQITVNGTINYNILYYPKNSEMVCGEEKEINFEENIKLMGINSEDNANVAMEVLSSSIKPVDGKNYIYKIQLKAYIIVEKIEDLDIATAIDTDSQEENYENNFAIINIGSSNQFYAVNDKIYQEMIYQGKSNYTIDTCIDLDTQAVSYLRKCFKDYDQKPDISKLNDLLEFLNSPNLDYSCHPYLIENATKNFNKIDCYSNINSFVLFKNFEYDKFIGYEYTNIERIKKQ